MANQRRARQYETYGSLAYQQDYQRGTSAPARRARQPERVQRPRVQPREQVATRPQVEVRKQSAVSPFAILGFAAVAICALLLVMTSARVAMANNEIVGLNSQLSQLQTEEKSLMAQYELAYDLAAIEELLTADGSMVKADSAHTVYLDLSQGDNVVYHQGAEEGISGLIRQAEQFLARLLS